MTKDNYNFDTMLESASSLVDEDAQDNSTIDEVSSIYKLDDELLKEGWDYDSTGIYIHFKPTFQSNGVEENDNFTTEDNIYLWINREFDTRKKILLKFKWAIKTSDGYDKKRGFSFDESLDIGDEKILKSLNQKVSFSGGKSGNPSSDGSYVEFVDYFISKIIDSPNLEVFKEEYYELPEEVEDETSGDTNSIIQSFDEYPEDIQKEALKLLNDGRLFKEAQKSVSLTHQGHKTSRDALILMESSLFIGGQSNNITSVHGLIGGESGEGKSDLSIAVSLNFPTKYVRNLRNVSPKYPFYAKDDMNDDYNILIFDDATLNDDIIELIKCFSDNTTKEKVLKTVKKQEGLVLSFGDAKFVVILTYAKSIPDNELGNRLFNLGVIVDKDEEKFLVKSKIRDNNVIGGNENLIIKRNRLIIQASIHYLIEQKINVFNPFLSIFNPEDYINRDVNHVSNMIKAKTFFEYKQRNQIRLNDDLTITIGDFDDYKFVKDMWSEDVDAQKYKLSERQKQILKVLPEMTRDEAYSHIEDLNEKLQTIQSRKAKDKLLDDESTKKNIAKKLKCNQNTLVNDLDRNNQGTSKSLYELGLIDKIQIDEDVRNSPNIYYKIKIEGESSESDESIVYDMYSQFTQLISYSITKQKILIDLLYYVNIIINEKGYIYLTNYCDEYNMDINVESYDSLVDFIQGFFDDFKYDEYSIAIENSSLEELGQMSNYKQEIDKAFGEKTNEYMYSQNDEFLHSSEKTKENAPIVNPDENTMCKKESHSEHNNDLAIEGIFEEIGVDFTIAHKIFDALSSGEKNLNDIVNAIVDGENPDDVIENNLPLKVEMSLKRLVENDYLVTIEPINQATRYKMTSEFSKLFEGDD